MYLQVATSRLNFYLLEFLVHLMLVKRLQTEQSSLFVYWEACPYCLHHCLHKLVVHASSIVKYRRDH